MLTNGKDPRAKRLSGNERSRVQQRLRRGIVRGGSRRQVVEQWQHKVNGACCRNLTPNIQVLRTLSLHWERVALERRVRETQRRGQEILAASRSIRGCARAGVIRPGVVSF